MGWDLKELRQGVRSVHGDAQLELVNPCLRTIVDRRGFAHYHYIQAQRLIDEVTAGRESYDVFAALMGVYDTEDQQFSASRFRAYSNVVACVQSLHSIFDNIVHLVYYVLGLNLSGEAPINVRDITWTRVKALLEEGDVLHALREFSSGQDFIYISDLNNHSKHRAIIDVCYSMQLEEAGESHGLRIKPFTYEKREYEPRWALPTLKSEWERQQQLIIRIGQGLNDAVRARG